MATRILDEKDKLELQEQIDKKAPITYVTPEMYGARGDGETDDTSSINECLANHETVYFPDGVYMIHATKGVRPKSGQTIILSDNAVLKCIPNGATYYDVIKLDNVSDVTIKGGKICGDKNEHQVTTGEFGYGIGIYNSQRITIDGCEIYDHWGDAVCIISRSTSDKTYEEYGCRDITVKNSTLHDCRRQGISVVGCVGFLAENVEIYNIAGTSPQSGIDFEVDDTRWNDDCVVRNTTIHDCLYGVFANKNTKNVTIDGCDISNESVFRQSERIEIQNTKLGELFLGGNESILLNSTLGNLSIGNNAKNVRLEYCSLWGNDETALFSVGNDGGSTSECVIDVDNCVFHSYEGKIQNVVARTFKLEIAPKSLSIKNSVVYINNPNGMLLKTTEGLDFSNNIIVVDYTDAEVGGVLMNLSGVCNVSGNTFKRVNSTVGEGKPNDAFLLSSSGAVVSFIGNRYLGNEKIGPAIFLHQNGGSIKAFRNVFRAYSSLGIVGEDVDVTEIGNVYSGTIEPELKQEPGDSKTAVMSQKATTDEFNSINEKFSSNIIEYYKQLVFQGTGTYLYKDFILENPEIGTPYSIFVGSIENSPANEVDIYLLDNDGNKIKQVSKRAAVNNHLYIVPIDGTAKIKFTCYATMTGGLADTPAYYNDVYIFKGYEITNDIPSVEISNVKNETISKMLPSKTVKTIAHRGLCNRFVTQNSRTAYIESRKAGYTCAENDIQLTSDGIFVMHHEIDMSRQVSSIEDITGKVLYKDTNGEWYWYDTTSKKIYTFDYENETYIESSITLDALIKVVPSSVAISETPYNKLKRINVGAADRNLEQIMTFEEWMRLMKRLGMEAYIDFKMNFTEVQWGELVSIVRKCGMLKHTTWIIDWEARDVLRSLAPSARFGFVYKLSDSALEVLKSYTDKGEVVSYCSLEELTDEYVNKVHECGVVLECWYVPSIIVSDDERKLGIESAISYGVEGIATDYMRVEELFIDG